MDVEALFDPRTSTLTYLVSDPATGDAVVIDPVLDFDPADGRTWTESVERVVGALGARLLRLRGILETHAHADHLSGAQELKARLPAPVAIGSRIVEVQRTFAPLFGLGPAFPTDGRQFDHLAGDGDTLQLGSIAATALHVPGHTPACVAWRIGDAVFTGDALFMPDSGLGRCDFPGGCAETLYDSIQRLYALPPETRVFVGHDYQPGGRELRYEATIGESMDHNVQLPAGRARADFVAARCARDATLKPPRLLFYSIQVNIAAGRLPPPGPDGRRYLVQPIAPEGMLA